MEDTSSIRKMLLKQIEDVVNGEANIEEARVVCDLSSQLIYTTRLELENKRLELELGKSDNEVKKWMERDFSNIQTIKG